MKRDKKITLKMIMEIIKRLDYDKRKKLYYLLRGAELGGQSARDLM